MRKPTSGAGTTVTPATRHPHWQRKILLHAIALAGAALQAEVALAACPGTTADAVTNTCNLFGNDTATITPTGSIIVAQGDAIAVVNEVDNVNITVTNSGVLQGSQNGIHSPFPVTGTINITNNSAATIQGGRNGIAIGDGGAALNVVQTLHLNNAGMIKGTLADSGTAIGVSLASFNAASTITNSGTISASATAGADSETAFGISINTVLAGVLNNTGTITATATDGSSNLAVGININNGVFAAGSLTNSGTITAMASGPSSASAFGIRTRGSSAGTVSNSGTINATATAGGGTALALGISAETMTQGSSLTNSGTINVTSHGGSGSTLAAGIDVVSLQSGATLTNSGTIDAHSDTVGIIQSEFDAPQGPVGIHVETFNNGAVLTNSGTVTASTSDGPGTGWALFVNAGGTSEGGFALINNSGTLNGNVHLAGTSLNNTGTLSLPVGTGGATDSSLIEGNYTQTGNGVLTIGALSTTKYGRVQVNGTADLSANGRLAVNVSANDQLVAAGTLDNVLHAGHLISGGTANLSVTDNSAMWEFTAIDDGENGIDLKIRTAVRVADAVRENGPTWALGAAKSLDAIIADGSATDDMATVIAELSTIPTSQRLAGAAAQTVPVIVAQGAQQENLTLDEVSSLVVTRMATRQALATDEVAHDKNLWMRGFGASARQSRDGDVPAYDVHNRGVVLGYDSELNAQWSVGTAIAYSNPQVKSKSSLIDHKIRANSYQGAAYAYWSGPDDLFVDLVGIGGIDSNKSTRHIQFAGINRSAHGNYDSWYARFSGAFGRDFHLGDRLTVTPVANLSYTYVSDNRYTESGAGSLNLKVSSNDAKSLLYGVEGRVAFKVTNGSLLTAHAGVAFDGLIRRTTLNANFVGGGPTFETAGRQPNEMLTRAGLGYEVTLSDRAQVHVNYEYEYRQNFDNNLLVATLRWRI